MGYLLFFLLVLKCGHTLANPSVSLTVEGGVSLVGEHCPGTVRLFCEGVSLPFLRWTYTASIPQYYSVIQTAFPFDRSPFITSVESRNPAFLTVEIVNIMSDITSYGVILANFSTTLTADLAQLAQQNITSITCGQFGNSTASLAINISILESSFIAPQTLHITNVVATYQSRSLDTVENLTCSMLPWSVFYDVILNSSANTVHQKKVNNTNCNINDCHTSFTGNLSGPNEYTISVKADKYLQVYPISIDQASAWYYRPQIMFISCSALQVSCTKSENANENSICTVNYHGADSQYEQILSIKRFSEDETTKILLLEPIKSTVHYLSFYLNVSKTFEIKYQFMHNISDFDCSQDTDEKSSGSINNITIIAVGILLGLLCCIFVIIISVVCTRKCINKERKNKMEKMAERTEKQRRAESPVYEEINKTSIFTKINLTINEAYSGISHPNN